MKKKFTIHWIERRDLIMTKVIGLIGADKYDFISYMAKALHHLNMKVLMVDYTSLRGLMSTIPEYIDGKITEYRELFYLGSPETGEIQQIIKNNTYDFIFMDFDYLCGRKDIFLCQNVVFLTDMQRHHIELLENIRIPHTIKKHLVFRMDDLNRRLSNYTRQIANNMGIEEKQSYYCPWGEKERKQQLHCQYYYEIPWKRVSSPIKHVILDLIHGWLEPEEQVNNIPIIMQASQIG